MLHPRCVYNLDFLTLVKRDFSGKMGFNEYKELWAALNQWKVSLLFLNSGSLLHYLILLTVNRGFNSVCYMNLHVQ